MVHEVRFIFIGMSEDYPSNEKYLSADEEIVNIKQCESTIEKILNEEELNLT